MTSPYQETWKEIAQGMNWAVKSAFKVIAISLGLMFAGFLVLKIWF